MKEKTKAERVTSMTHSHSSENVAQKEEEEEEAKMLLKKWESNEDVIEESTL